MQSGSPVSIDLFVKSEAYQTFRSQYGLDMIYSDILPKLRNTFAVWFMDEVRDRMHPDAMTPQHLSLAFTASATRAAKRLKEGDVEKAMLNLLINNYIYLMITPFNR